MAYGFYIKYYEEKPSSRDYSYFLFVSLKFFPLHFMKSTDVGLYATFWNLNFGI
jgi:hypothetical protein